jgi:hypothetical protein
VSDAQKTRRYWTGVQRVRNPSEEPNAKLRQPKLSVQGLANEVMAERMAVAAIPGCRRTPQEPLVVSILPRAGLAGNASDRVN